MEDYPERQETFSNRSGLAFNPQRLPGKYLATQTRIRQPTEKGLQYQIELKQKSLARKKAQAAKHVRQVLLNIGRTNDADFWKQKCSKAQVKWAEFGDIYIFLYSNVNIYNTSLHLTTECPKKVYRVGRP